MNQTLVMLRRNGNLSKSHLNFYRMFFKPSDKQLGVVKGHIDFKVLGEYLSYVCNRIKGVRKLPKRNKQKRAQRTVVASSDGQ